MMEGNTIQTLLFTVLCICFIFYLFLGISSYRKDSRAKINILFFALCISACFWAIGYAFMLISPTIEIANGWRIFSGLGWCLFNGLWVSFALSLRDTDKKNFNSKKQILIYIPLIMCFLWSLTYEPSKVVSSRTYGFVDSIYTTTAIGTVFSVYIASLSIAGIAIIYFIWRNSQKNRVRKQMKIILITGFMSFCLTVITDLILPSLGIIVFPFGIITISIGMGGMWYAINKHKMMSISYELVSEYIFEAVKEPIFILGEDYLVKICNEAAFNTTGYHRKELEQNSLDAIINFRNSNFHNIMESEDIINLEVDLLRKNKEALVCELAATVIHDEYQDILGILILLHDVSERKKIAELQIKYTVELEKTNLKLKNEIVERMLAENQIQHLIYHDHLTELFNRKKMLEDLELLLVDRNKKFAVLFIDLDHFKSANDHYCHEAGDLILKTIAKRLKNIIQSTDIISRMGGDEFIIILKNLKSRIDAEKTAEAVLKTLSPAFSYKESQLVIGASIGISIFPEHGIDAGRLINKADSAMYEVKRLGGNGYKVCGLERGHCDVATKDK